MQLPLEFKPHPVNAPLWEYREFTLGMLGPGRSITAIYDIDPNIRIDLKGSDWQKLKELIDEWYTKNGVIDDEKFNSVSKAMDLLRKY